MRNPCCGRNDELRIRNYSKMLNFAVRKVERAAIRGRVAVGVIKTFRDGCNHLCSCFAFSHTSYLLLFTFIRDPPQKENDRFNFPALSAPQL